MFFVYVRFLGNIVNELEENLNMIEEIDGYIKIVRSFPLVSLNFLKSLKVIHGYTLESSKYDKFSFGLRWLLTMCEIL